MLTFTVDIKPIGKPRPRAHAVRVLGGATAKIYRDPAGAAWESAFASLAREWRPAEPLTGPLWVTVDAYFCRPRRLMRRKDPAERIPHAVKPDADNVGKIVMDAMAGFWGDDAQVCHLHVRKFYTEKTGRARIAVSVATAEDMGQG